MKTIKPASVVEVCIGSAFAVVAFISSAIFGPSVASAAINGAWGGGLGLGIAFVAHRHLSRKSSLLTPTAIEIAKGARIAGVCLFLHRVAWWNMGIWTRPDCEFGPPCPSYAYWALDYRAIAALLVIGIIYGGLRAMRPLLYRLWGERWLLYALTWIGSWMLTSALLAL